jgi:serine-type D-Ala-D-Ala carboxypeptidase/endopeptidase (penicillin-binding protein 4)
MAQICLWHPISTHSKSVTLRWLLWVVLAGHMLSGCRAWPGSAPCKARKIRQEVTRSEVFRQSFTGFSLLDATTGKTLADYEGDRYFIPGSNIKLLTLAACLEVLPDSIPGLQYAQVPDAGSGRQWVVRGTGDPTFLHPEFAAWQPVFTWLQQHTAATTTCLWSETPRFGAGWAWDDFNEWYSPELSCFPMYGNTAMYQKKEGVWKGYPALFAPQWLHFPEKYTEGKTPRLVRQETALQFYANQPDTSFQNGFEQRIPFHVLGPTASFLDDLLRDTFHHLPFYVEASDRLTVSSPWKNLYSCPVDTVLRRMLHQSDNFFAEQLLLLCARQKFDTLWQKPIKQWVLDSILPTLLHPPKWADGSGLSRYNLMTPQSATHVLLHLWRKVPKARLFDLLPAGGVSGTIANLYAGRDGKPYVYAKSGSMGSVYCISGYVVCKSGKVLIFSFMHNNFYSPNQPWKSQIQQILELIHDTF